MAANGINKVILIGDVMDDGKLGATPQGTKRLRLRLHTVSPYTDATGATRESHGYHTVVVWGRRAEALAPFLTKGRRVAIEGRLHTWRGEGEKARSATEVVAEDLVLLDGPREAARDAA